MKTTSERKKIRRISHSLGNQLDIIKSFNRISMDLAAILDDFIKANEKMTQKKLAEIFGKKESEISKWLSGKHNFTIKSIALIEETLGSQLLFTKYDRPNPYISDLKINSEFDSFIVSLAKFEIEETLMKKIEANLIGPSGNTIWLGSKSLCISNDPKNHSSRHKGQASRTVCLPIQHALVDETELYQGLLN